MPKPVVAIVGRPNVGKSALFNRLAGQRLAVVDDVPGTTRDRLYAESEWVGTQFLIVDTGGIDPTSVTRGRQPLSIGSAEFIQQIREQAQQAVSDADLVMFVVDVESGVTPADREVASILRRSQRKQGDALLPPVLLVVNKVDSVQRRENLAEFYELGMGEPHPVSAVHGSGTGDMLDALVAALPPQVEDPEESDADLSIAIVGKPNAGKSTLLNALVGEERAIVSDIPGTTRDTVDSFIDFDGQRIKLIDTAGLRRRGKIEPGVEKYSAIRSVRAIERAEVVLLVIDATTGITAQDAHIAGYVQDAWKSAVILVNKWDAVDKDSYSMEQYTRNIRYVLKFIDYAPLLFISAQTGQRVQEVLPTAVKVGAERMVKLSTSQINRVLEDAQEHQPAPNRAGRNLRIYYGTQVRSDPPTFLLYCNDPKLLHFTYERYLENRIRDAYGFLGTPIRIVTKKRE
ncbi:MAG: ribosome biogenesis GTPase Der [Anaerolineales bacterium]|nr:MAG: ribosome biogenesis GTPase Der [Anaerolineales bacterium]